MEIKDKIIIFGLGGLWDKYKNQISEEYNIIAYTDNDKSKKFKLENQSEFISVSEIQHYNYDYIVIFSTFYKKIESQLFFEITIEKEKIINYKKVLNEKKALTRTDINKQIELYNRMNRRTEFEINYKDLFLETEDVGDNAGCLDGHYFIQDIWAAKKILENNPINHYDIGSRIDGFISHLLVFRKNITLIDIRPLDIDIDELKFICADATNLEKIKDNSIESLSSLHAVEHFGLGRYGDLIDPEACFKVMKAIQRVIKPSGKIYFGVPIGPKNKLCFNAYRIFNPLTIINEFNEMTLVEFSYIKNFKIKRVDINSIENEINNITEYSCGLFEFIKK